MSMARDLGGETGTHHPLGELGCTLQGDYDPVIEVVISVDGQELSLGAFDWRTTCYEPSR